MDKLIRSTARWLVPAALLAAATAASANDGFGLELRTTATPQDVQMPIYPKAVERPPASAKPAGKESDAGAVRLGLWSPSFGFRMAALKLHSADKPEQVLAFYRQALAAHGAVLTCTADTPVAERQPKDDTQLRCDDDRPRAGGVVLKVGTREDFRVVAVYPQAAGTQFDLVRLAIRR
jgi:hypothetical protein